MKFTLSWLKDHLESTATLEEIATKLVDLGLEVESISNPGEKLKDFVVGHVIECGRHPNADRLSLCQVDDGSGSPIQVVCGAPNVRKGMKVVFARTGTIIPESGQALKKGVIRDVESCGMLCSSRELELGTDHDGIIDLQTDLPAGSPAALALHLTDPVIELSITANRADCFGIRGIARDLAAAGLGALKPLPYGPTTGNIPSPIIVSIADSAACPGFTGVYLKGVSNQSSPAWVQQRLTAIGLRPINALVDVTNYLAFDLARPLHVFDADKVKGNLTVRLAKTGEQLAALNDKTYDLTEAMTVIADENSVLALAGVMGGSHSGCTDATTNVFVECALFDPIRTAHTGRALQLLSDSRTRFERGVDPESLNYGLDAAIHLIQQWCGGTVSTVVVGQHQNPTPAVKSEPIILTETKLKGLSGCEISLATAAKYLTDLGFQTEINGTALSAVTPSYRHDIEGPADLVEEILRLYGYDNIPGADLPKVEVHLEYHNRLDMTRRALAAQGLKEAITWSFMDGTIAEHFGGQDPALRLTNPISQDLNTMRPTLVPNLMMAAIRNHNRGIETVSLFEVGPQYQREQQMVAAGLRSGPHHRRHWHLPPRAVDVYDAKADVIAVLTTLGVSDTAVQVEASAPDYYHPGRSGCFKQGNRILAYFGELHPKLSQTFDADQPRVAFEIFVDNFQPLKTKKAALILSPYQPVSRDFAFIVDQGIAAETIAKTISKVDRALITSVDIFDVYQGDKMPETKKSIAVAVRFEPTKTTLTDTEIQEISTKIILAVEKATGGTLRQ